jgi:uncharacterized protein with HEPN domain
MLAKRVSWLRGRSWENIATDRVLSLALIRLVEVIGEAAGRVPQSVREKLPDIPWFEIIGLRNRLIHGYDSVDLDILGEIIATDLPDLVSKLHLALQQIDSEDAR